MSLNSLFAERVSEKTYYLHQLCGKKRNVESTLCQY